MVSVLQEAPRSQASPVGRPPAWRTSRRVVLRAVASWIPTAALAWAQELGGSGTRRRPATQQRRVPRPLPPWAAWAQELGGDGTRQEPQRRSSRLHRASSWAEVPRSHHAPRAAEAEALGVAASRAVDYRVVRTLMVADSLARLGSQRLWPNARSTHDRGTLRLPRRDAGKSTAVLAQGLKASRAPRQRSTARSQSSSPYETQHGRRCCTPTPGASPLPPVRRLRSGALRADSAPRVLASVERSAPPCVALRRPVLPHVWSLPRAAHCGARGQPQSTGRRSAAEDASCASRKPGT